MKYFHIFVMTVICSTQEIRSETITKSVINFCSSNGLKFISFLGNPPNNNKKNLQKEANKYEICSRYLSSPNIEQNIEVFTDTFVIFDDFTVDLEHVLKVIQSRKILKSILVLSEDKMDLLHIHMKNLK